MTINSIVSLTGILDDLYALCMARKETLTSLLALMGSYREELEYIVLSNLITVMSSSKCFFVISYLFLF